MDKNTWKQRNKVIRLLIKKVYMQVTKKGQVTIPQEIRERFGFLRHTEVEFIVEEQSYS